MTTSNTKKQIYESVINYKNIFINKESPGCYNVIVVKVLPLIKIALTSIHIFFCQCFWYFFNNIMEYMIFFLYLVYAIISFRVIDNNDIPYNLLGKIA